jgi:hypothetical protein
MSAAAWFAGGLPANVIRRMRSSRMVGPLSLLPSPGFERVLRRGISHTAISAPHRHDAEIILSAVCVRESMQMGSEWMRPTPPRSRFVNIRYPFAGIRVRKRPRSRRNNPGPEAVARAARQAVTRLAALHDDHSPPRDARDDQRHQPYDDVQARRVHAEVQQRRDELGRHRHEVEHADEQEQPPDEEAEPASPAPEARGQADEAEEDVDAGVEPVRRQEAEHDRALEAPDAFDQEEEAEEDGPDGAQATGAFHVMPPGAWLMSVGEGLCESRAMNSA